MQSQRAVTVHCTSASAVLACHNTPLKAWVDAGVMAPGMAGRVEWQWQPLPVPGLPAQCAGGGGASVADQRTQNIFLIWSQPVSGFRPLQAFACKQNRVRVITFLKSSVSRLILIIVLRANSPLRQILLSPREFLQWVGQVDSWHQSFDLV